MDPYDARVVNINIDERSPGSERRYFQFISSIGAHEFFFNRGNSTNKSLTFISAYDSLFSPFESS